ncbi:RN182 ligase, partial [Polyodon spathula]|nr:RN182 ligase [Polyodon spathula]
MSCETEERLPSDELECKICYQRYNVHNRKPKILDCLHRVCARCLNKILDISDGCHCISCPFCRHETEVTEYEVAGLPDDMNIMSELATRDKSWSSDTKEVVLTPKSLASSSPSHGSSNCLVITIMENCKDAAGGLQVVPYSLEIAGLNPCCVIADCDRGFLGGGAQHNRSGGFAVDPQEHISEDVCFSLHFPELTGGFAAVNQNKNNNWAFQIGEKTRGLVRLSLSLWGGILPLLVEMGTAGILPLLVEVETAGIFPLLVEVEKAGISSPSAYYVGHRANVCPYTPQPGHNSAARYRKKAFKVSPRPPLAIAAFLSSFSPPLLGQFLLILLLEGADSHHVPIHPSGEAPTLVLQTAEEILSVSAAVSPSFHFF